MSQDSYFSPKGRIRRSTYLLRCLLLGTISVIIEYLASHSRDPGFQIAGWIVVSVLGIVNLIQFIKRLHDIDLSGWYSLLCLIPIFNIGFWLYVIFKDGVRASNRFGADPKNIYPINSERKIYSESKKASPQQNQFMQRTVPDDILKNKRSQPSAQSNAEKMSVHGQIQILNGWDRGLQFPIFGYPTAEGLITTLGRSEVLGIRARAHIRVHDRYKTVSREQLQFIYRDGFMYVKNLSQVNPTQINDITLTSDRPRQIVSGDRIRTGELEFVYQKD